MIGYPSVGEAEEGLGRNLTLAETLWFHYSAEKPDYFLHFHNIIFFFLVYTIAPLPYMVIELKDMARSSKIQGRVTSSFSDMLRCYKAVIITFLLAAVPLQLASYPTVKAVIITFLLAAVPLQLASYPTVKMVGIRTGLTLDSPCAIFVKIVVYAMVEDYAHYWLHRLLHTKWGYENIHHVHHEFTAPIGLAAPYAHWSEVFILGLPSFLGPALAPCHITTYWLWFVLRNLEAIDTHCGYDMAWSPTKYIPFYGGAAYHDYHHYAGGTTRTNFASVFTYCDYIYGTDKGYRYQLSALKKA